MLKSAASIVRGHAAGGSVVCFADPEWERIKHAIRVLHRDVYFQAGVFEQCAGA